MLRSQPSNGLRLGIAALLEIRAHFSHNVPPITSDRLQAAFKVVAGLNQRQTAIFMGIKPLAGTHRSWATPENQTRSTSYRGGFKKNRANKTVRLSAIITRRHSARFRSVLVIAI